MNITSLSPEGEGNIPVTVNFSNPRRQDTIQDWPLGSNKRGPAVFSIESNKKGERVIRTTTGKPKASTYYKKCVLVDGDDGKTYFLGLTAFDFIAVMHCDMKYQSSAVFEKDTRYQDLLKLFIS